MTHPDAHTRTKALQPAAAPPVTQECGYCGGVAEWNPGRIRWEHADAGDRVPPPTPGDFISGRHNLAGTPVLAADLVDVLSPFTPR